MVKVLEDLEAKEKASVQPNEAPPVKKQGRPKGSTKAKAEELQNQSTNEMVQRFEKLQADINKLALTFDEVKQALASLHTAALQGSAQSQSNFTVENKPVTFPALPEAVIKGYDAMALLAFRRFSIKTFGGFAYSNSADLEKLKAILQSLNDDIGQACFDLYGIYSEEVLLTIFENILHGGHAVLTSPPSASAERPYAILKEVLQGYSLQVKRFNESAVEVTFYGPEAEAFTFNNSAG